MNESMNIQDFGCAAISPCSGSYCKKYEDDKIRRFSGDITSLGCLFWGVSLHRRRQRHSGMPKRRRCGHPALKKAGVFRKRSKKNHKQRTCSFFYPIFLDLFEARHLESIWCEKPKNGRCTVRSTSFQEIFVEGTTSMRDSPAILPESIGDTSSCTYCVDTFQ